MIPLGVKSALKVANFLWPDFVEEHGCVFLGWYSGSNPPPPNDTATGWESFINHTHIFDEFTNKATSRVVIDQTDPLNIVEAIYDETHPDFVAASELGRKAARLWATKLKQDFPQDRFRVYYTEYDNPIVRFHKVRANEHLFHTNEDVRTKVEPWARNMLVFDTDDLSRPVRGPSVGAQ